MTHTETTSMHPLSLHDALPICVASGRKRQACADSRAPAGRRVDVQVAVGEGDALLHAEQALAPSLRGAPGGSQGLLSMRSEEHTSELQSHHDLACRLLLEKKKI